jgi:hypothetical protein
MTVKVTLEFDGLASAAHFLLNALPGGVETDTPEAQPESSPASAPKTRARKAASEKPAATPAATAQAPAAAQGVAPAGAVLDDAYLKALTESVLAVAAEVERDAALAILAKYKMADGVTPIKQCSGLPKEAWVAVKTEADAILVKVRAAKEAAAATATSTSLI